MTEDKTNRDAKDRLLESATVLFAEKGVAAVSIRELATAAGVNSALISYHFGGKEGLYEAVLTTHFGRVIEWLEQVAASPGTPQEKIRMYAEVIRRTHTTAQPFMGRLIQREMTTPTPGMERVIRSHIARIAGTVTSIIREGIETGAFRKDIAPIFAALSLAGMLNFYFIMRSITQTLLPEDGQGDEGFVESALKIYLEGMEGAGR